MGVQFVLGQHDRITAKERDRICDCWGRPGKGLCECDGCFLQRERRWRAMTDAEQAEDDRRRDRYAKTVVRQIKDGLEQCESLKQAIKGAGV
jgi:hypothetical protein